MNKSSFNHDHKDKLQKVLDYQFNLDSPQDHQATESLISQDAQARKLQESLQKTLSPLDQLEDFPVPSDLTQRTLQLITQHRQAQSVAQASAAIVAKPDSYKQEGRSRWVLASMREWIAVAASIMLMFWVMQPGLRQARSQSQQIACFGQMRNVGQALASYASANGGYLPHVKQQPGVVWWNVGEEGEENRSNTRNLFLLVKQGYVDSGAFLCPGSGKQSPKKIPVDAEVLEKLQDFICRMHVNYSIRLSPKKYHQQIPRVSQVIIMTDQNPLFVNIDCERPPEGGVVTLNESLSQANSLNHGQRGQNILTLDVAVRFHASRFIGVNRDDIFTIQSVERYLGKEMPQSRDDVFIAP